MKKTLFALAIATLIITMAADDIYVPWHIDPARPGYIIPRTGYGISPAITGMPITLGIGSDSSDIVVGLKIPITYSQGIVIDTITYINVLGTNPRVVPSIRYGLDISDTGTAIIYSPAAVTSNTTTTKITTFNNSTIPAGQMLWLSFDSTATKPKLFFTYVIGHKL